MNPFWTVDGDKIRQFQGRPREFVQILNALLAHQVWEGKLPHNQLHLNVLESEPDGGVDAVVDSAIPNEDVLKELFSVPTVWQFKACSKKNIKDTGGQKEALKKEINKPHTESLIKSGYGYRLCIADDMPHRTQADWEKCLKDAARKINPNAPAPMIITASNLAKWIDCFPALLLQFCKNTSNRLQTLSLWKEGITKETPYFTPVEAWEQPLEEMRAHVDFVNPGKQLLTVHGVAGVGKTRCVYEALAYDKNRAENEANRALVVYTSDELAALEFANHVIQNQHIRAILVADECTLETREKLRRLLPSHEQRFRIIAIDNSLQREGGLGEIRLPRLNDHEMEQILTRNFAAVFPERRQLFASLAEGFVRLAVDLCSNDSIIPQDPSADSLPHFFRDYIANRLKDHLDVLLLVSLLPRVGYRDEVREELQNLCAHLAINANAEKLMQTAYSLRQSPGFIAFGGRFLYVTPDLIARIALQMAWEKWIACNPKRFFECFPNDLLEPFIARVKDFGSEEMRREVADFFFDWVAQRKPPDLANEQMVVRLSHLVQTQPDAVLPLLCSLVENCSTQELYSFLGAGSARRQLVWLAEKLTYFPEHFWLAERILLRLALAETEPHLGNNASKVWANLFRIVFSGVPIPFADRLRLLEERLCPSLPEQRDLAFLALENILGDVPILRLATPPIVFGRVPPTQWGPADDLERAACRSAALAMVGRLVQRGGAVAEGARRCVVKFMGRLFFMGHFAEVRAAMGEERLSDTLLPTVIGELDKFLDLYCREYPQTVPQSSTEISKGSNGAISNGTQDVISQRLARQELEFQVREWYRALLPADFHGRLVAGVGTFFFHQQIHGDHQVWQQSLEILARELLADLNILEKELPWLCSSEAHSSYQLGQALGSLDIKGLLLERMLGQIPLNGGAPLARGYLKGLIARNPQLVELANRHLDQLEALTPQRTYEIIWANGDAVGQFERTLRMVDSKAIAPEFLRSFEHGIGQRVLTAKELRQTLDRLFAAARNGNLHAAEGAISLLDTWLHRDNTVLAVEKLHAHPELLDMVETSLTLAIRQRLRCSTFTRRLFETFAQTDEKRAIQYSVAALGSLNFDLVEEARMDLTRAAHNHPEIVMEALGSALLNHTGDGLYARNVRTVINALPFDTVRAWLETTQVQGARALARQLDPPYIDNDNQPMVPRLTQWVMEQFGNDKRVFHGFFAGSDLYQNNRGNIIAHLEKQAEVARQFYFHANPRIRKWAIQTAKTAKADAARWQQYEEERKKF